MGAATAIASSSGRSAARSAWRSSARCCSGMYHQRLAAAIPPGTPADVRAAVRQPAADERRARRRGVPAAAPPPAMRRRPWRRACAPSLAPGMQRIFDLAAIVMALSIAAEPPAARAAAATPRRARLAARALADAGRKSHRRAVMPARRREGSRGEPGCQPRGAVSSAGAARIEDVRQRCQHRTPRQHRAGLAQPAHHRQSRSAQCVQFARAPEGSTRWPRPR